MIFGILTAIIGLFSKRLLDRIDNLGQRMHRMESLVTGLLVSLGLRDADEGLPPLQ